MPEVTKDRLQTDATPTEPGNDPVIRGQTIEIIGTLKSAQDFVFAGKLNGSIGCQSSVVVLEGGHITGNITAQSVILRGTVMGNISVIDTIEICKDAKLVGDIKCARIMIEDGAYFKGSIDISKQQKKVGLALLGSLEASKLDDVAENEIVSGDYEDLSEYSVFQINRAIATPGLAVAQELNFNASRR